MKYCFCEVTDFPVWGSVSIDKFLYNDRIDGYTSQHHIMPNGDQISDATHKALIEAAEEYHNSLNRREKVQRKYRHDRTTPVRCELCKHRMACIAMPEINRTFEARE